MLNKNKNIFYVDYYKKQSMHMSVFLKYTLSHSFLAGCLFLNLLIIALH